MIVVVDASVAIKWYVSETYTANAERLLTGAYELNAPELIIPEFGNILWKKVRRNQLTEIEAAKIIAAFGKQSIVFHSHKSILEAAFIGAEDSGQTVYDWTYLALAVSLSCRFVTADEKFYKALVNPNYRKHLTWVGDI